MTDETTVPEQPAIAETASVAAIAPVTLPSYSEASTDASIPETELQKFEAELHKLMEWAEKIEHEVAGELKVGINWLITKVKAVI